MEIKERLEAAIEAIKCVRSYYEAEVSTYVLDETPSLPHPGDMLQSMSSVLATLHGMLGCVVKQESREKDS